MFTDDACNYQRGFGLAQYAETMHKVMITLGYEEYGKDHSIKFPQSNR